MGAPVGSALSESRNLPIVLDCSTRGRVLRILRNSSSPGQPKSCEGNWGAVTAKRKAVGHHGVVSGQLIGLR